MGAMAVNGHSIAVYDKHIIKTEVTDSRTDIQRYDAVLGWPWVFQDDPDCHFRTGEWTYRESGPIHEIDATEMFELERLGAPIYAVFVTPANPMRNDGVELSVVVTEEVRIPPDVRLMPTSFPKPKPQSSLMPHA